MLLLNGHVIRFILVQVEAPAKAGSIAPINVFVAPQNTGLGPEKTSFFQALSIATKISKGTIEILSDVHLIKKDDKVGFSEAALLQMLKVFPFSYGLKIQQGMWVWYGCDMMWVWCDMGHGSLLQFTTLVPCFLPTSLMSLLKT